MPTFHEILPATKTHDHASIRWTPSDTERGGWLEISQGRKVSTYIIIELEADGGRAFRFVKQDGTSDANTPTEDAFVPVCSRLHPFCSCKGFTRHSLCKHTQALAAIAENRWFSDELSEVKAEPAPVHTEDELPECFRGVGSSSEGCPF